MKKILLHGGTLVFILWLGASCALEPGIQRRQRFDEGQVFIYLSTPHKPSTEVTFSTSALSFKDEEGLWTEVSLEREVRSSDLSEGQLKLEELFLPAGKYNQMRWHFREAKVTRGNKRFSLALPEPEETWDLNLEFEVFPQESLTLFVTWDPDTSILNEFMFRPKMSARKQGMEIKRILAYVTNGGSDALTVIDKQSDRVVGSIAVGRVPKGVAVNGDGTRVYVANSGSKTISVVDTVAGRVTKTINNFGYSPSELLLSADDQQLYAVNSRADSISVFDTASEVMITRIDVGRDPSDIALDADGDKLYVANRGENTVSVIDIPSKEVEDTITVELGPSGLAVQDGKVYVANHDSNTVSVIALGSNAVSKTIAVGQGPVRVQSGLPDWVYVANANSNDCDFIYSRMDMVTQRIAVEDFPRGMGVDTLRRKLYVVNKLSDTVSIVDLASKRVKGTISTGREPHDIAVVEE